MYVIKSIHYVQLLTDKKTTPDQVKCLLVTANTEQMNALSEIFYNIYSNHIKVDTKTQKKVKKILKVFESLSDLDTSHKKRLNLLKRHLHQIFQIITTLNTQIRKAVTIIGQNRNGGK